MVTFIREGIGFSTGVMYAVHPDDQEARLASLENSITDFSLKGLELFLWNEKTTNDLLELYPEIMLEKLRAYNLSIHAPRCRGFHYFDGSFESKNAIHQFQKINQLYHPEYFVFHPDWIANFPALLSADLPIALENTDSKNADWQTPEVFIPYVLDGAKIVLDIGHLLSLGVSNQDTFFLLNGFMQTFDRALAGYHVSDCDQGTGLHRSLASSPKNELGRKLVGTILKQPSSRLIIESVFGATTYQQDIIAEIEFLNEC